MGRIIAAIAIGTTLFACGRLGYEPLDSDGSPGPDSGPVGCTTDANCDDGRYCNGVEACGVDGTCGPSSGDPCDVVLVCDESTDACLDRCDVTPDFDLDGFAATACGGTDCDDDRGWIFPGAPEACDGLDGNCDGMPEASTVCDVALPDATIADGSAVAATYTFNLVAIPSAATLWATQSGLESGSYVLINGVFSGEIGTEGAALITTDVDTRYMIVGENTLTIQIVGWCFAPCTAGWDDHSLTGVQLTLIP